MTCRKPLLLGLVGVLVAGAASAAALKVLYEKTSPYNKIVVTEDDQGLRTLSFGNGVRQSVVKPGDPDHLELRYAPAMLAALALVEEPRRVLIVGLGGGTIPGFLRKHYPRTAIDVVDIDPDVVAVAKRFFGFREDSLMRAHVMDGRKFIEECRNPYDVDLSGRLRPRRHAVRPSHARVLPGRAPRSGPRAWSSTTSSARASIRSTTR